MQNCDVQKRYTKHFKVIIFFSVSFPQMDSGGPVLWENPTTHNIILVGITSSGIGCASNEPAIDTRTGAFIDWIVSVTPGKS